MLYGENRGSHFQAEEFICVAAGNREAHSFLVIRLPAGGTCGLGFSLFERPSVPVCSEVNSLVPVPWHHFAQTCSRSVKCFRSFGDFLVGATPVSSLLSLSCMSNPSIYSFLFNMTMHLSSFLCDDITFSPAL